jgi:hypothetical protein
MRDDGSLPFLIIIILLTIYWQCSILLFTLSLYNNTIISFYNSIQCLPPSTHASEPAAELQTQALINTLPMPLLQRLHPIIMDQQHLQLQQRPSTINT